MKLCKILGIPVINRSPKSCKYKTSFCSKNCYNNKLYVIFGHTMNGKDIKNDEYWEKLTPDILKEELSRMRVSNNRIRFMARGEAFETVEDVFKVKALLKEIPYYLFWIPTRAWRNAKMKSLIEKEILTLPNNRIMASIDPSNTKDEVQNLKDNSWSTMFFGDNKAIENRVICPKTWTGKGRSAVKVKVHRQCRTCNICFSDKRVDVHLKKH